MDGVDGSADSKRDGARSVWKRISVMGDISVMEDRQQQQCNGISVMGGQTEQQCDVDCHATRIESSVGYKTCAI